jgi:hypothetical protein
VFLGVSQNTATFSFEISPRHESLQMIEQPYQCSKLRYRSDYNREKARLGVLTNRNEKSKIKGPAIKVSSFSLFWLIRTFLWLDSTMLS